LTFWGEFGRAIKEGVAADFENKDKILALLLFQSSNDPEKLTTLKDYVGRMKPEQEQIFYLTGDSRAIVENSPHLEALRDRGYEVLYLVDPVDELLLQYLHEFEKKKLKSAGKGAIELDKGKEKEEAEKELKQQEEDYKPLLEYLQKQLDEHVKQVRISTRLTTSPACLVVEEHDQSPRLERLLQRTENQGPKQRRVLELNPKHALVGRLRERYSASKEDPVVGNAAEVLFGLALLLEGSPLADPGRFNRAATEVLGHVV
jgi:molecular chaperone HtpG